MHWIVSWCLALELVSLEVEVDESDYVIDPIIELKEVRTHSDNGDSSELAQVIGEYDNISLSTEGTTIEKQDEDIVNITERQVYDDIHTVSSRHHLKESQQYYDVAIFKPSTQTIYDDISNSKPKPNNGNNKVT